MKTTFCCLLLACSAFQLQASGLSNSLSDRSEIINELKTTIRSIIDDLSLYQTKFQSNAELNLKKVRDDSYDKIRSDEIYVSKSIKNAVVAVSTTGKNAESCYEVCRASLKNLNKKTNEKLNKCYYSFSLYTAPVLKEIKHTIKNAENISSDLDYIFIGCSKHLTTEDCLSEKIQEVRKALRNMQVYVATIKSTGSLAMNKAMTVVTSCSEKAVSDMHVEATFNIQREANICVRNIYKKDK